MFLYIKDKYFYNMGKKPLVPNKNPKGRGKGMGSAGKVAKAPRMTRICSRLSKDRLTILIEEVDSIAKGFKGLKGLNGLKGGGRTEDYYERIKRLFSEENTKNIKRLKEDLVINILGTMASGLENLVDFKDNKMKMGVDELKRIQLLKFISIINEIDNLGQEHISKIIMNDRLKELDYIDKITTLVMINILKKVYKSRFTNLPLKEITFKYLYNTKDLIMKITQEYNGKNDAKALKDLTEDVKRQLEYYNYIYILNDYAATKGDENDAIKIIEWMKLKCIGIENDEFIKFINHSFLEKDDFTTGCITNLVLKEAIDNYNETIKSINETYNPLNDLDIEFPNLEIYINFINYNNPINKIYIEGLLSTRGLLSPDILYKLYKYIIYYEDKMKLFPSMKTKYIECVKVFYEKDIIINYELKKHIAEKDINFYKSANISNTNIEGLKSETSRFNETFAEIYLSQEKSKTPDFFNNIPINIEEIIGKLNRLCNANENYNYHQNIIFKGIEAFKDKNDAEAKKIEEKKKLEGIKTGVNLVMGNIVKETFGNGSGGTGGKLTTKYISTGNFVYILYEKKKIRRCVYAKAKGRGKYCKIKGDYILVSKLKVV